MLASDAIYGSSLLGHIFHALARPIFVGFPLSTKCRVMSFTAALPKIFTANVTITTDVDGQHQSVQRGRIYYVSAIFSLNE